MVSVLQRTKNWSLRIPRTLTHWVEHHTYYLNTCVRTGSRGKGRERSHKDYLCRQVHIGYTTVSPSIQTDCLWLSCENRGTCVCERARTLDMGRVRVRIPLTDTRSRVVCLAENAGRMTGVELWEPRNLCECVSEECGHGKGEGAHATLLTDTRRRVVSLAENAGRMTEVELWEPRNLCECVSEECGHVEGEGAHTTLPTDTRRRVVSLAENAGRMTGVELRDSPPPTGTDTSNGSTTGMDNTITTESSQVMDLFMCLRGCRRASEGTDVTCLLTSRLVHSCRKCVWKWTRTWRSVRSRWCLLWAHCVFTPPMRRINQATMSTSGVTVVWNRWGPSTCRANVPRLVTAYVNLDEWSCRITSHLRRCSAKIASCWKRWCWCVHKTYCWWGRCLVLILHRRLKMIQQRAEEVNKASLEEEKERDELHNQVEQIEEQLHPKRVHTHDDDGDAHEILAEVDHWDLRDHRQQVTSV